MQVRLLGPVRLWTGDRQLDLGTPQQRCVFAVLAVTPRQTVPVDTLVDRVWGEQTPRNVRTVLYTYVSRLRGLLQEADAGAGRTALRRRDGGYALEIAPERIDLHRSRWLASQARAAGSQPTGERRAAELLGRACDLWAGTPLSGVHGDWADRIRTGLDHEHLALITERFDAALRIGGHDAVIGPLSQALAAYPLTESLASLLMLALHRSGRHADALQVYSQLRRRLVDELGDGPGPTLRTLHEQILRRDPDLDLAPVDPHRARTVDPHRARTVDRAATGPAHDEPTGGPQPQPQPQPQPWPEPQPEPAVARPARPAARAFPAAPPRHRRAGTPWVALSQLPPDTRPFVGRDPVARDLVAALSTEPESTAVPIITVTGPPGVGKTALAIRVAHLVRDRYPDGQWYVRLDGARAPRDPVQILAELLETCGLDGGAAIPEGLHRRAAALRSRLADRRVLLLLDDASDAAQVRPLLPGTAGSAVLVTSRRLLGGLAGAGTAVRLDPLGHTEAIELLSQLAGVDRTAGEPDATAEISAACGRLPLALRIAAARLAAHPEWTIERYATRLRDRRRRLDELALDDLDIRASLDLSYQSLDPPLQTAFRRIALLGNTDLAAWAVGTLVEAAPPGAGRDGGRAVDEDGERLVEGLVGASLLDAAGTDPTGEPRYRLHDLIATYASELAEQDDPGHTRPAQRRYLDVLLTITDAAHRGLPQETSFLPPGPGFRPAAPAAADVARLTHDPWAWLTAEHAQIVRAIQRACQLGWHERAAMLADRALPNLVVHIGWPEAEKLFVAIRDTARDASDDRVAWRAECQRFILAAMRGRLAESTPGLRACADAFERIGARTELAFSLAEAAAGHLLQGERRTALDLARKAVRVAREGPDQRIEASATAELAGILADAGRCGEALPLFDRALALAAQLGQRGDEVTFLMRLAAAALDNGDAERADAACRQALERADETVDPRGMAWLLDRSARIAIAQGRPGDAVSLADDAVTRFTLIGDAGRVAKAPVSVGRTRLAAGQPER